MGPATTADLGSLKHTPLSQQWSIQGACSLGDCRASWWAKGSLFLFLMLGDCCSPSRVPSPCLPSRNSTRNHEPNKTLIHGPVRSPGLPEYDPLLFPATAVQHLSALSNRLPTLAVHPGVAELA